MPLSIEPAPHASCFSAHDRPTWELYSTCVHCGLCLQQCPTYRVLGTEMESPRGRIYQVMLADEGRLPIGDAFVTHIDRCLGCLACQTACPSGVPYGHIVERARAQIEQRYHRPWLASWVRHFVYAGLLGDYKKLARWARRLRWYQHSWLARAVRASGLLKLFGLAPMEALAPQVSQAFSFEDFGAMFPARGERRGRVALLAGCVGSVAFDPLNRATIRVLQANGLEVIMPEGQGCCGALHAHAGRREEARTLARNNIRAFEQWSCDAIVTNAAGCGSAMKDYVDLLAGSSEDSETAASAQEFVKKVRDVTEYLAELGVRPPAHPLALRATYQDPCHLAHAQRIRSAPRELLRAAGVELVEMQHPDYCCGSAGVYNVVEVELAGQILEEKMDDVAATSVNLLVTANTGCMLQLRSGVARRGLPMQVKHVIEVLDEAY
ncbi:MAG: (Fe-S)-binding protein [Candidatus Koribacter versatilis]|uniref:Glycolate oxidase iron-sulfur subunit n=1 Tax=Candidatus Korobacter versatilis TaxID=658062 RepID=A0A932A9M4_9BACT|nr:(Fe-S)-binding protein [Candidatus Koribacter versatilis]